jgi:signal transduction histidine kinase/HAMP domain-containing protein
VKPRVILLFLATLAAPLAALTVLGIKVAGDEREMLHNRFDADARQELAAVDGSLARVVQQWERELDRIAGDGRIDADTLRRLSREERRIRQVFVIGPDGKRLHPPIDGERTRAEDEFLQRTRSLWESREPLFRPTDVPAPQPAANAPSSLQQSQRSYVPPTGPGPAVRQSGWHAWYWGEGLNLLYWKRDDLGRVIGVEADRMALLADLVGELPQTGSEGDDAFGGRIRLLDANRGELYAWGPLDPEPGVLPRVVRELSPPLASLELEYYPAPGADALGGGVRFGMITGFAAFLLVLAGLAAWFLRESGREIRDARQRVGFVNQVSHELKTPLTNIRMYAELLDDRMEDEDEVPRGYVRVIVSESQRLSRLIGNVLSFARQGRGRLAVRPVRGQVDAIVADVIAQFRPSLESKGMEIEVAQGAGGEVLVDADALGQILGNLLGNVEKYAASGQWVRIETQREGTRTTITVSDRGPGIPAPAREKVFQPFFRLSDRVADGAAGTGIGLTIARELARLHGGDLTIAPSGTGTCFRLVLVTEEAP